MDFTLKVRANKYEPEFYETLNFFMFATDHELFLDEFGEALKLPIIGPGRPPETFHPEIFWK